MLSSGTRIGPSRIESWLGDGSCGQSYESVEMEGETKGSKVYVKLIPREVSERKGFSDYFLQECQALEQLAGPGIWPVQKFGVMKWKHWAYYPWLDGRKIMVKKVVKPDHEEEEEIEVSLRTLADLLENDQEKINPDSVLDIMTGLHQGINRAHLSGVVHGNLKPSNILIQNNSDGDYESWATEFGLWKMKAYVGIGEEEDAASVVSANLEVQDSIEKTAYFRPEGRSSSELPSETWDLFAVGKVVIWIIEKKKAQSNSEWSEWLEWANQATSKKGFPDVAVSMQSMPGMVDISDFGMKVEDSGNEPKIDDDEVRIKRKREWALTEKLESLRFRRNMTGLVGGICLLGSLFTSLYTTFWPKPWSEYSIDGILDSYQLGLGVWSGQAWGIVPAAYDDDDKGGQNVVGEWEKEGGVFKLSFRKFKINPKEEGDKKLWQYIGTGKTSPDDYHNWQDYLRFDQGNESLILVKRVDERNEYRPGRLGDSAPRLFPVERFKAEDTKIIPAELAFVNQDGNGVRWVLFFSIGFLLLTSIYHREMKKTEIEQSGNG